MAQHPLDQLIQRLSRLPGLGPRSARRTALYLLKNRDQVMLPLANELDHAARTVRACLECGNLDLSDMCAICRDSQRDSRRICVVEDVSDLWAIERAGIFSGLYHILGGTLSALDGRDFSTVKFFQNRSNDRMVSSSFFFLLICLPVKLYQSRSALWFGPFCCLKDQPRLTAFLAHESGQIAHKIIWIHITFYLHF